MESNRQVVIHMNHKYEPRKAVSAAERFNSPRRPKRGSPNNSRGIFQWTDGVCVGDMSGSDARVSGEICHGE